MTTPMIVQRLTYNGEVWLNGPELAAWAHQSEETQRERGDEEGAEAFASAAAWIEDLLVAE